MPSSCDYRQLVLVDTDDGRLSLFKDHQKYLSHMAPNCEWVLFWNDLRLPVYKKLKSATQPYSRIHLCPSYYQRPKNSLNSDLLTFLEMFVPKFSFVLLVHGYKQNYSRAVQRLRSQHGEGKIAVHKIGECSSQQLPSILSLLVERNAASSIRQSVTNVASNDHLKFRQKPRVFRYKWPDSLAAIPYGLIELIYFKQLIKRKQKRLNIYYSKNCPIQSTFLQPESIGHDELEQNESDYLTAVFERKFIMKLQLISYETFTTLTQEQPQTNYLIEQYSLSEEKTEATPHVMPAPKLQKNRKSPKQKLAQPVKKTPESDSKEVSCSRCTKKFKDQVALQSHFWAKHSKPSAHEAPSQRQASLQDDRVWVTYYDNYINYSVNYPLLSDHYGLSSRGNAPITAAHINSLHTTYRHATVQRRTSALMINGQTPTMHQAHSILPIATTPLNPSRKTVTTSTTQLAVVQPIDNLKNKFQPCLQHTKKTKRKTAVADHSPIKYTIPSSPASSKKMDHQSNHTEQITKHQPTNISHHSSLPQPCLDKSGNGTGDDSHSMTKHPDRTLHFTTSSEAVVNTATIMTKSPVKTYPCSRCSIKFKSTRHRLGHFIKSHRESILPTATSIHGLFYESRTCWDCGRNFESADGQISHFIDKHAQAILLTEGDPSSLLQTKISMAHEKMEAAKAKEGVAGKLLSCSKCTTKFKGQVALQSHVVAKHSNYSTQQFPSPGQTVTLDKIFTGTDGDNPVNNSPYCSQLVKRCVSLATTDDQATVTHSETDHKVDSVETQMLNPPLTQVLGSVIHPELEETANLTQLVLSTANISFPLCHYQMEVVQEEAQRTETRNSSADKLLPCSQCTEEVQSIADIKQHFDSEHTTSTTNDAPTITADSPNVVIDQATLIQVWETGKDQTESLTQRSPLPQLHPDGDRTPHYTASSEAVVISATIGTKDHTRMYPCSKCYKEYKSARDRLDHFIKTHSESFLPAARSTERSFIDSRTCWECNEIFKSSDSQISHFIDKHAQAILLTEGDPSSLLQAIISVAQEKVIYGEKLAQSLNPKRLQVDVKHVFCAHDKKSESTSSKTSEVLSYGEHKTARKEDAAPIHYPPDAIPHGAKRSEERMPDGVGTTCSKIENEEPIASATTKSFGKKDAPKIHKEDNTAMSSTGRQSRNFLSGQDIFICPRARFSSIVYVQLKTIREQLIITPGRTNRCPFKGCTSETGEYEFEELCLHTSMEHKDASLQLECCDPARTYTLEEYKNHLESASRKNMD